MPALQVIDAAYPPSTAAMVAAGVIRKCRYLYNGGKGYTVRERDQDRAHGAEVLKNYESYASALQGGYAMGRQQAQAARGMVQPDGNTPTVLSADYDITSNGGFGVVEQAIRGAQSVLGADIRNGDGTGIYGEYDLIEAMWKVFGPSIYYWQTYAWSRGRLSVHADLYQWRNGQAWAGATVDFNAITGRWVHDLGATLTPAAPKPLPFLEDTDMNFIVKGAPNSKYPGAIFIWAGSTLSWVEGQNTGNAAVDNPHNAQVITDLIYNQNRYNSLATNGRLAAVNYQSGSPINSAADIPVVADLPSLGAILTHP